MTIVTPWQRLNLPKLPLARSPIFTTIYDQDLRLRYWNSTIAEFICRYTGSSARYLVPGARLFDLAPDCKTTVMPILKQVLAGETVRKEALFVELGGTVTCWNTVLVPLMERGVVIGFMGMCFDITELMLTRQILEERLNQQNQELSILPEVSNNIAYALMVGTLLDEKLATTIPGATASQPNLPPNAADALDPETSELLPLGHSLTECERRVLNLMTEGLSNREIAERLVVSYSTVKFHVSNILFKLSATNRSKAVALAVKYHLTTDK